ncbi:MAG: UDP-N-acetylmuramate--L-alanine ligase [Candidatus Kapaibacterium sp.]
MFRSINNIHFVGIGGIGMSGIAELLLAEGFKVSGSDLVKGEATARLEKLGARIVQGHAPENIVNAEVVVYSSAVKPEENPETREAMRRKIPLIRRAEMLAEVTRLHYGVAVAGTHGKTTTTSMIGLVLIEGGVDPTVIVGGKLADLGGTNARRGKGEWTVVEADEYDRSFLSLLPTVAVITNLESEHLDIYSDLDDLKGSFIEFANKVPFYGFVALCLDEESLVDIMPKLTRRVVSYGTSSQCDVRASDLEYTEGTSRFTVSLRGKELGTITLGVPGLHNVKNALAAVTVGLALDLPFKKIARALGKFSGVYRRFELKGEEKKVMVIDDYAHHPTEVKATLEGVKRGWNRRVVAIFQPHTYTRTRDFHDEFGKSFLNADLVVITDIYPAREQPIEGVTGELVAQSATDFGHRHVNYVANKDDVPEHLVSLLEPGDIVLTMGAGDIWKIGEKILQRLKEIKL